MKANTVLLSLVLVLGILLFVGVHCNIILRQTLSTQERVITRQEDAIESQTEVITLLTTLAELRTKQIDPLNTLNDDLLKRVAYLDDKLLEAEKVCSDNVGHIWEMADAFQIRESELLERIRQLEEALKLCELSTKPIEPAPPLPSCDDQKRPC